MWAIFTRTIASWWTVNTIWRRRHDDDTDTLKHWRYYTCNASTTAVTQEDISLAVEWSTRAKNKSIDFIRLPNSGHFCNIVNWSCGDDRNQRQLQSLNCLRIGLLAANEFHYELHKSEFYWNIYFMTFELIIWIKFITDKVFEDIFSYGAFNWKTYLILLQKIDIILRSRLRMTLNRWWALPSWIH